MFRFNFAAPGPAFSGGAGPPNFAFAFPRKARGLILMVGLLAADDVATPFAAARFAFATGLPPALSATGDLT